MLAFLALPAFWWAITGVISVVGIWLFKKPVETTGFFASIPLVGWVIIILILLIILRSRR